MRNLIRLGILLLIVGLAEAFVSPPPSCWIAKGFNPGEVDGESMTLLSPGGAVGTVIRRLTAMPAETSGRVCRETLLRAIGLG